MKSMLCTTFVAAILICGCRSVGTPSGTPVSDTARPVQSVIQASAGLQIEMFDQAGNRVQELPHSQKGSVSIFTKDKTGQDNYTFGENGFIIKHLRSYGANYSHGVWEEVK